MFTVHTKNKAPETGFSAEPASTHKTADAALSAAKELATDKATYGNTILVTEAGTNRSWTVQHMSGEASVGYDEGVPFVVPSTEQYYVITYDAREVPTEIRREDDETTGSVAVFLDHPAGEPLIGDFEVTTEKIEV